jgi:hypothetical protein
MGLVVSEKKSLHTAMMTDNDISLHDPLGLVS